ncbi:hypothetical protein STEG23_019892 [Scotinomys teguina]
MWRRVQRELHPTIPIAFPVFQDNQQQRYHEPLDFKTVKSLAESVRTYGVTASFTVAQIEALSRSAMTPSDWSGLAKTCLNPGQYLDWKSFLIEFAGEEAAANRAAGNAAWDQDMLLGVGRYANAQIGYPIQVYEQINKIGIRAWKALPNRGEVSGNLTKITQGTTEPFSDFVARMVEAAGGMFGDAETAMALTKQLIYEQCTKDCRAAITPYRHRPLEADGTHPEKQKGSRRWEVDREVTHPLVHQLELQETRDTASVDGEKTMKTKENGGESLCRL